ncbi:hypothetical protein [Chryseobacterium viscerum]|uniref:C1q domain-containing protein n=1 Tax=Chryseobacterium viscerum TaxID=1037377 RepID=A0A316WFZ1_9FLAO|nr:hypothetical protein [Chryseobacterium viscerum]PWN57918.1 hypothetical protein C1634_025445 [Chryseobacterium viscerum]
MKLLLIGILIPVCTFSQVGINTALPKSTLDITAKNAVGSTTNVDGILIPRIDRQRAQSMNNIPTSTLVFINDNTTGSQTGTAVNIDTVGYYYYNGTIWVKLHNPTNSSFVSSNIYSADGALSGNRTVMQRANTLAFTGNATNAFSVDGNTFSVDAANNRIGIRNSSPATELEIGNATETPNPTIRLHSNQNNFSGGGTLQFVESDPNYGTIMRHHTSDNTSGSEKEGLYFSSLAAGIESTSPTLMLDQTNQKAGIGTTDPTEKLDVNGNMRLRDVPTKDLDPQDNYLGITNTGVLKRINLNTSSFILFATKTTNTNRTGGEGNNTNLDFDVINNINSNYIERVSGSNKFRVKKSGIYSIEIVAKFNNISVGNDQEKGVALRLYTNNDHFQVRGERWANNEGSSYLHRTVILNQNDEIYLQTQTGKPSYTQSPGSSIFITYVPN